MTNYNIQAMPSAEIHKQLQAAQGSGFELESMGPLIERRQVQPRLLTALLTGVSQTDTFTNDTFVYDEIERGNALPSGKPYSGYGPDVQKDKAKSFRWAIPSFGFYGNVQAKDWANRRTPGTVDTADTEARHLAALNEKMGNGWDLFMEQNLISLITTDQNDVAGGSFESYNFYSGIVGGSRTVQNIDFDSTTVDPITALRNQKKALMQEMIRSGEPNSNEFVMVCGDEFFAERLALEEQEGLGRALLSEFDFQSQEVTSDIIGSQSFRVDNFVGSRDGIRYVLYSAAIGSSTIGADDAYLMPVQASNFIRVGYAPAQDREYANTEAQSMYGWTTTNRTGLNAWQESNYLTAMVNPRLLIKLRRV
tara:strand:- start:38071 stop:39165 length:1095 start_codon:yes stop_codon:yes gene_type:complete